MPEPTSDKHYEEKFEYPLWKLIKQRANEKDISYVQAKGEVLPDYQKTMRYRDTKFEDECIARRMKELADLQADIAERRRREKKSKGG